MSLCSFSTESIINNKIEIDNIFINDFLPYAPEGAVKVYIYGLYMCSQSESRDNTLESFSKILKLSEQDILDSFLYWQEQGIIQVLSTHPIQIKYMPIKNFINNSKKYNKNKYKNFNIQAQEIIKGRMITPNEYTEYYTLIEIYHLEPEALLMIMQYCVNLKNDKVNYSYILTVAKNWANENITTSELVEERLKEFELQNADLSKILKLLGSSRKITVNDHNMYKKWTDNYGFLNGTLINIAKYFKEKKSKISIEYLDSIINKYFEMGLLDINEIFAYEEEKTQLKESAKNIVKSMGLYYENLETVIETYLVPWINMGYEKSSLLQLSKYCFKKSIRTLDGLNSNILKLYKLGIVSNEAIEEYIRNLAKQDTEIKYVLEKLNLSRNVNKYDREYYKTWKYNWKINDILFDYGIELSKDKSQPMQYLNKIYSKWNENKITTKEEAEKLTDKLFNSNSDKKTKSNNSFLLKGRSYKKQDLDALFDNLDEVDI